MPVGTGGLDGGADPDEFGAAVAVAEGAGAACVWCCGAAAVVATSEAPPVADAANTFVAEPFNARAGAVAVLAAIFVSDMAAL